VLRRSTWLLLCPLYVAPRETHERAHYDDRPLGTVLGPREVSRGKVPGSAYPARETWPVARLPLSPVTYTGFADF
jgi:hypothetical protein